MKVGELFATLGLEVDGASFTAGERALHGIKRGLEALAVFEGVRKITEMIEATSNAAEHAVKSAEKLGTTTEAVQELGYAAEATKIPAAQLEGAMLRMSRSMDQAQTKGKGPFADAMRKLGVSMQDPAIKAKDLDGTFMRIADGFADLPEGSNKSAIAMQLFGRSGATLIPLLNKGADGIRELREEAWDLGIVIDGEVAKQFVEWEEQITRVKGAATGLRNDAVIALLPKLKSLTDALFVWIKANRELIKQRLEKVMDVVVQAATGLARALAFVYAIFEKLAPIVSEVTGALADMLGMASDASNTMEIIALGVAAVWAIANLPLLLMLGLVAVAILLIADIWSGMNGGDSATKELLDAFERNLGESGVGRVLLGIKASVKAVFDYLEDKVNWLIKAGEKLGELFFNIVHPGGTQGDIDRVNDLSFPQQMARMMGMPIENSGIDSVVQAAPNRDRVIRLPDRESTGLGGVDRIDTPASLSLVNTPTNYLNSDLNSANMLTAGTPVNVSAPQMNVTINVSSDFDQGIPRAVQTGLEDFWGSAMRDTVISTGGGRNKLP